MTSTAAAAGLLPPLLLLLLQIEVREIGGANCVVLQQDAALGSVATIVLRGSTEGFLDDVERAVDDGINAYKVCSNLLIICLMWCSSSSYGEWFFCAFWFVILFPF
jgi:hypothetical protein